MKALWIGVGMVVLGGTALADIPKMPEAYPRLVHRSDCYFMLQQNGPFSERGNAGGLEILPRKSDEYKFHPLPMPPGCAAGGAMMPVNPAVFAR